jgi:thiol-disulfide isomerase/thioredoxin
LNQPVTVPKGDGPLDLGSMAMSVQPAAQPADQSAKPAGPMVLPAQSLDGQPLALSQYKGKYVLLAFWATWSDRCTEQLGELAALDAKFGSTGKFTILGVNLDEDAAAARRATKERGYPWQQAWLDAGGRVRAMTNLNLSSLPSFCLVGPDGRVIAHDLTHDRLTQTVQRTLKAE